MNRSKPSAQKAIIFVLRSNISVGNSIPESFRVLLFKEERYFFSKIRQLMFCICVCVSWSTKGSLLKLRTCAQSQAEAHTVSEKWEWEGKLFRRRDPNLYKRLQKRALLSSTAPAAITPQSSLSNQRAGLYYYNGILYILENSNNHFSTDLSNFQRTFMMAIMEAYIYFFATVCSLAKCNHYKTSCVSWCFSSFSLTFFLEVRKAIKLRRRKAASSWRKSCHMFD